MGKRVAHLQELTGADGKESDLVEEPEQPGRSWSELSRRSVRVPHLHRSADELVASGALHAVDAQIRSADTDRVLGRPRARRVVFRGDESMARIDRRRDRRAQIYVTEAEHQIARVE